jgi:uncharacterized membrane protein
MDALSEKLAFSGDLAGPYVALALGLAAFTAGMLALELVRGTHARATRLAVAATGVASILALLAAVLRPVAIQSRGTPVGPRVVVLVDGSRSIDLPGLVGTRRQTAATALAELDKRGAELRQALYAFGDGPPVATALAAGAFTAPPMPYSDLTTALEAVAKSPDERPSAIVVLSDGRLDRPAEAGAKEATVAALASLRVPVHTLALAKDAPADASIRAVKAAGAAVAHQPLSLRIELGCDGGLVCDELPVTVRELRAEGEPTRLAQGTAKVVDGKATLELSVTLDRAGPRVLEVAAQMPKGDTIADNDRRLITIDVARERVRILHVAGRPTYDVRALRTWLKSDASVDVVAFFILRTPSDEVNADQDELALIPFPVDELFSEHLSSFDAVVLQDFNARPYGLSKYLGKLADYVTKGGGLIMVGGPDAFVPGHYAGTELARVLPIELSETVGSGGVDLAPFVPRVSRAGAGAPVLQPLRALLGESLPEMPGTNLVGDAREGATVILEHPSLKTPSGARMPVLALGEHEGGRTIALTVDGSHRLSFSAFAAGAAGRAHGAFWDAMLGWLMRDPRFEPAAIELPMGCIAGEETKLRLRSVAGDKGKATVVLRRLGSSEVVREVATELDGLSEATIVSIGRLDPGGYSASLALGEGSQKTHRDFACERGGSEWADSRPDLERLRAIADATGGKMALASDVSALPMPEATQVISERHVSPLLPPWAWTVSAAALLGAHWVVRRRGGLA